MLRFGTVKQTLHGTVPLEATGLYSLSGSYWMVGPLPLIIHQVSRRVCEE